MVLKHWNTRVENYFKADVLFTAEQVFSEDGYALTVPQQTIMSTQKRWRSTTALLYEVAQYALAGNVGAWWVQNGKVLDQHLIEPKTDKAAVSEYFVAANSSNKVVWSRLPKPSPMPSKNTRATPSLTSVVAT
jgi:hypothetical protein